MEKASPRTRAGSLSQVARATTTFIFPRNPESDICLQVFILYPTHTQIELKIESYPKKCWPRQTLSCVRSFDLLVLGGPALLSAFIWKISSPPRRDFG